MDLLSGLESPANSLFRRCVNCPPNVQPACPTCPSDQICSFITETCDHCASTTCVAATEANNGAAPSAAPSSGSPANSGAIAGAVIGGIVVIAIATFLVWRFCIKNRSKNTPTRVSWNQDYNLGSEKDMNQRGSQSRDQRASTHTVASVASSAYTRASNIIQIAYIPGVTNRSVHSSQDLVPPVPPIPAASPANSPRPEDGEQHYFRPEIRDSRYSAVTDRNSMARNSIASTIYRNNAIVSPVPAQMISRVKPTAVSVRSSNKNSPTASRSTTPPLPANAAHLKTMNSKSSIVGRVGQPKPVQITRKGSREQAKHIYELDGGSDAGSSRYGYAPNRQDSTGSQRYNDSPNEDINDEGRGLMGYQGTPPAELSAHSKDGHDNGLWGEQPRHKKGTSLNQIIEEAALSASRGPGQRGLYQHPEASPFDDTHEAHTP